MIEKNLKVVNLSDFSEINWEQILYSLENDVNFLMNEYLSKVNSPLDTHAPLKTFNI